MLGILMAQVSFGFLFSLLVWDTGRPARVGHSCRSGFLSFSFLSVCVGSWEAGPYWAFALLGFPFFSFCVCMGCWVAGQGWTFL